MRSGAERGDKEQYSLRHIESASTAVDDRAERSLVLDEAAAVELVEQHVGHLDTHRVARVQALEHVRQFRHHPHNLVVFVVVLAVLDMIGNRARKAERIASPLERNQHSGFMLLQRAAAAGHTHRENASVRGTCTHSFEKPCALQPCTAAIGVSHKSTVG
eukprot:1249070-Pleurochrysis_carterae.AAC.4